jgi:hypothetical protein
LWPLQPDLLLIRWLFFVRKKSIFGLAEEQHKDRYYLGANNQGNYGEEQVNEQTQTIRFASWGGISNRGTEYDYPTNPSHQSIHGHSSLYSMFSMFDFLLQIIIQN